MDRLLSENDVARLTKDEARALFTQVFGDQAGQMALLYILVKVGGLADLRYRADAQSRLIMDGKREAALEIMDLAGFSPFHLAARLMALPQLHSNQGTMDHDNPSVTPAVPAASAKPGRAGRATRAAARAPAASPAAAESADPAEFGGDR